MKTLRERLETEDNDIGDLHDIAEEAIRALELIRDTTPITLQRKYVQRVLDSKED